MGVGGLIMTDVSTNAELVREAYATAEAYARASVGSGDGFVSPKATVGSLSPFEWKKLIAAAVSGWIIERVAQASREQIHPDNLVFVNNEHPPMREIGKMAGLLPSLGSFVEERGLSEKPVGDWERDDVLTFAWLSWKNGDVSSQHFDEMDQDIPF